MNKMEWLKNALKWIATDGLLHILVCYALMLTFTPIIGAYAIGITIIVALAKEVYDFVTKRNNLEQVVHDLICDAIGIGASIIAIVVWWLVN